MRTLRLVTLVGLAALGGCGSGGYSTTGSEPADGYKWRSLYREDVATVAIPIFANTSFERGVEFSLTQALVSQLEANSPYKVVPAERADTILEGEIISVRLRTLSEDTTTALPQEQLYGITVNFTWKDLRSGRILVERRNFEQTATMYPTLAEGRFVASQVAVERLAIGITQEMQADW